MTQSAENDVLDRRAMRAAHQDSYPMGNIHHGTPDRPDWGTFCIGCKESWPCEVTLLLDFIDSVIPPGDTIPTGSPLDWECRTCGESGALVQSIEHRCPIPPASTAEPA